MTDTFHITIEADDQFVTVSRANMGNPDADADEVLARFTGNRSESRRWAAQIAVDAAWVRGLPLDVSNAGASLRTFVRRAMRDQGLVEANGSPVVELLKAG